LLGDRSNQIRGINYRHVETEAYQGYNQEFISFYRHSTQTELLQERRCIERWFILSDFLRQTGIESFYFLDSDYLLFCSLSDWEDRWLGEDVCGTPDIWGFSYIPKADIIHRLCDWIMELYRDEGRFKMLEQRYRARGSTGLQEMGIIREFFSAEKIPVRSLSWCDNPEGPWFDDGNFGFFNDNPREFSRLSQPWAGGEVSFREDHTFRRLLGLHCGGNNKSQIPGHTGWHSSIPANFFRPNYRRNLKFLIKYAWNGRKCRQLLQKK
jgi:hypothetical protein